jgi:hypothetical protein
MPPTTPEEKLAGAIGFEPQTVNSIWGRSTLGTEVFITLPSGQTCYARVIGMQGVLEAGVLGEADSLSAFVGREYIRKVRGAKGRPDSEEIDPKKLMSDPKSLQKIVKMVDGLTPHVVSRPEVRCHYEVLNQGTDKEDTKMIPKGERQPGVIYTDMIPLEDKMFLFNFAMSGVKEVETFRQESARAMGDVVDGEGVSSETQHPDGNRASRRKRPPRRR